jgi:hypothetical protein
LTWERTRQFPNRSSENPGRRFASTGAREPSRLVFGEQLGGRAPATAGGVDVVDYPDSKKIAVTAGVKNADFKTATYVGLGRLAPVDYYDGEDD